MKYFSVLVVVAVLGMVPAFGQEFSVTPPTNCGTSDQMVVTAQQLFGSGSGYGCFKTLIFPQFAVGGGWTTYVTEFMPVQPPATGLVGATNPGFRELTTMGSAVTASLPGNSGPVLIKSLDNGCLGLWEATSGIARIQNGTILGSGNASFDEYTGLATKGECTGGTDMQLAGSAQGPMQVQVVAPSASALSQATVQLTYFYGSPAFDWQVTVDPIDINNAQQVWTAPLFQGGDYTTAFSVVNVSSTAQTVSVALLDVNGNPIGQPQLTPSLAAGCGCNQPGQSAAGGFYAATVADFFSNVGTLTGSIQFTGTSGNIMVLVLRTIQNSLGSVPAK